MNDELRLQIEFGASIAGGGQDEFVAEKVDALQASSVLEREALAFHINNTQYPSTKPLAS